MIIHTIIYYLLIINYLNHANRFKEFVGAAHHYTACAFRVTFRFAAERTFLATGVFAARGRAADSGAFAFALRFLGVARVRATHRTST
jgi:hypothetical protein